MRFKMKLQKKVALVLSAFILTSPLAFADTASLTKEIAALELELVKLNTKTGEYADWSDKKIEKQKEKTKKTIEKKKAKLKKEAAKDGKNAKKELKKAGESIKDAGKSVGNAVSEFFD